MTQDRGVNAPMVPPNYPQPAAPQQAQQPPTAPPPAGAYPQQPAAYPYPYPYPYPPPVAYVPPPVQPGKQTFEGLGRMRTGAILAMVTGVVGVLLGLYVLTLIGTLTAGNIGTLAGGLVLLLLFAVVAFIVGLIALVFALWGLYTFHEGRQEFGAAHSDSVKRGVNMIIFGMVMQVVSVVAGLVLGVSAITIAFNPDPNAVRNALVLSTTVELGIGLVAIILYGLGMQLLLAKLMTARGRGLRTPFLTLAVGSGVVTMALGLWSVLTFDPLALTQAQGLGSLGSVVSIISIFLYYRQLQDAEQGARNMIQSGQFDPDAQAPMQAPVAPPV